MHRIVVVDESPFVHALFRNAFARIVNGTLGFAFTDYVRKPLRHAEVCAVALENLRVA